MPVDQPAVSVDTYLGRVSRLLTLLQEENNIIAQVEIWALTESAKGIGLIDDKSWARWELGSGQAFLDDLAFGGAVSGLARSSTLAAFLSDDVGSLVRGAGARDVTWAWRANLPGRGPVDAARVDEFLRRAIDVPDDVRFIVDETLPSNTDARWLSLRASDPEELVTWS